MSRKENVGKYRVRRGWGGVSVLQKCVDLPTYVGPDIYTHLRSYEWIDVPYHMAPGLLIEESLLEEK